ncbi:hypothetical protein Tco_1336406 [Tanacetum coccineum]
MGINDCWKNQSWYALTESPTIYVSIIEQFWQNATGSTLENGDMEITTTIDGKVKVVSEASIRRHLKLEDSDGQIFQGEGSTIPVESHHIPIVAPSTSQPHHSPTLRDFIRQETEAKKVYGVAYTKLIKKVKRLEDKLNKSRRKRRLVLLEEEDSNTKILAQEDLSKEGRMIAQINDDEGITLVQMGAQTQGKHDHEMEADFEFTIAKDVSTANVPVNTAGEDISIASPKVKTAGVSVDDVAAESLVYIRRSATKRKDNSKAIMEESEPTQTKTKVKQEQERLGFEEAQRLQEQFDKEERQRIANVHEEARTFKPEE